MLKRALFVMLCIVSGYDGGVTTASENDASKLLTEDLKNLKQVYGKISDKHLYGSTLPPSITFDVTADQLREAASNEKERYLAPDSGSADAIYPYSFGEEFPQIFQKQTKPNKVKSKQSHKYDKPVNIKSSHFTNPDSYSYSQYLEPREKQKFEFPTDGFGGFKPYFSYVGSNPENGDSYTRIQDILDGNEARKETILSNKYQDHRIFSNVKSRSKVRPLKGNGIGLRSRCRGGACKKRSATPSSLLSRPGIKIKRVVVNY